VNKGKSMGWKPCRSALALTLLSALPTPSPEHRTAFGRSVREAAASR
jgi:hypothetical protein